MQKICADKVMYRDEADKAIKVFMDKSDKSDLKSLTHADLIFIPKHYLMLHHPHAISIIWDKLPRSLQHDRTMQLYQICREHPWNEVDRTDHIDGPEPIRLVCHRCVEQRLRK